MEVQYLNLLEVDLNQIVAEHFANLKETHIWTQWCVIGAKLEKFSPSPDGFLADHYSLKITVEGESGQITEPNFFVKCSPVNNPTLARYLKEIGSFKKESRVLGDIITAIQRYCPSRTIAPSVYYTKDQSLLVMKDMKRLGFSIKKQESGFLDYAFLRQALKTLACLHAGSLVLEEKFQKPLPELYPNVLNENAWVTTPNSTRLRDVENVIKLYTELVQQSNKWKGLQKNTIMTQLPELFRLIYNYTTPSTRYRNCLNHGDLWCNNVMFKCDENDTPIECILVDYQLSRYVPPAYDINLLLYLTSSRQQRNEQYNDLLEFYYDCFCREMHHNQLDANCILSRNSFLQSCEHYRLAGLIHSTMISSEVTLPSVFLEEIFNTTELTAGFMPEPKVRVCIKAFHSNTTYRNRLLELMEELFSYIITQM